MNLEPRVFKVIIIAGGPCSGKGNVVSRLKGHLSGAYLQRELAAGHVPDRPLEPQVISMSAGLLAKRDDPVVGAMVAEQIKSGNHAEQAVCREVFGGECQKLVHGISDIIVDGVIRMPVQAEEFTRLMRDFPYPYELVCLFVDTPAQTRLDRMRERAKRENRIDDTDGAMARRQELYDSVEIPAVQRLNTMGVPVYRIDGSQTREGVATLAIQALGL